MAATWPARGTRWRSGLSPQVYVVATDLGIEKGHHFNYTRDGVAEVAGAAARALQGGGCCCQGVKE